MAIFVLEDLAGTVECVVFPRSLPQLAPLLVPEAVVFVRGRLDLRREKPSLRVQEVVPADEAPARLTQSVTLRLAATGMDREVLRRVRGVLAEHAGTSPVYLSIQTPEDVEAVLAADRSLAVQPGRELAEAVEVLLGEGHLFFNTGDVGAGQAGNHDAYPEPEA
jgi:DNA polymerase-3 subunit alpha